MNPHDLFNNLDPRQEMNDFNSSRSWVQSTQPSTQPEWETDIPYTVSPHPMTGSNGSPFELEGVNTEVNTDDYEISELETTTSQWNGGAMGGGGGDAGLKRYSPEETTVLARCFIDISEDPIIGNNQKFRILWDRVAEKYNAHRPRGTIHRVYEMFRKHWAQVQKDVQKWGGLYANAQNMCLADVAKKANDVFFAEEKKAFKYVDVWQLLQRSPKFRGGSEAGSGSGAPKRTKTSASGDYSTSGGAVSIDLNQEEEEPDNFGSLPGTQSRPMGTKAVKRKGKGKTSSSGSASLPPSPPNPSLDGVSSALADISLNVSIQHMQRLIAKDTSEMNSEQLRMHNLMIRVFAKKIE